MTFPLIRYPLDPTGINPDNLIVGEIHTLSTRPIRAVAPTYGAFYTQHLQVFDDSTGRRLVRSIDYQCTELLQDASLRYGQEVSLLILILEPTVSSKVRINYQLLGGDFTNNAGGVKAMYETAMSDNRPVDWINVLNKPQEYTPTIHRHMLEDMYGFEPIVAAIERLRNAIILSDVPALEYLADLIVGHTTDYNNPHRVTREMMLVDQVENLPVVSEQEVLSAIPQHKYVTHERLLQLLDTLKGSGGGFASYKIRLFITEINEGYNLYARVDSANIDDQTILYWTIQHITSSDADFTSVMGPMTVIDNQATFGITIKNDYIDESTESFRILIKKSSLVGTTVAVSQDVRILDYIIQPEVIESIRHLSMRCCMYEGDLKHDARSYFVVGSKMFNENKDLSRGRPDRIPSYDTAVINLTTCCVFKPGFKINAASLYHVDANTNH